jgi:hypothetical protein
MSIPRNSILGGIRARHLFKAKHTALLLFILNSSATLGIRFFPTLFHVTRATTITTNIAAKVSAISNAAPPSFMLILSLPQIINNGIATNIKITMKLDKRSFTSQQ